MASELGHLKKVEPPSETSLGRDPEVFISHISKANIIGIHPYWENLDIMHVLNIFLTLFSLLVGISSAHAEPLELLDATPGIVNHIKEIQDLTVEMATVVQNWNGDVLDALAITAASNSLIEAIEDGTKTATNSEKMKVKHAIKVKRATKKLVEVIKSSLNTITRSKLLFDHAGLTSIMISRLEETKEAADTLIAAIVDKLPKVGKRIGRKLGRKIAAAFDSAIEEFSKEPGQD